MLMQYEIGTKGREIRAFADTVRGEVVLPGHPEYDAARAIWNGAFDRYPAVIVRTPSARA
jgi:hypothetical protein